ncbi:two-component regulator propeller domain-containing protein [Pseudoalteromonas phenolica]|uniref:two-component regulator propeller domain-containing protein n=1 Tax=Pseudoalteromonas phenolica TaxID=161398 RepID=UPI0030C7EA5B
MANEYAVKKLTAEDGFVSSEIYSIIQDQQGLIWFGTAENGVMRYDGRKVTLFEFDSMSDNGLSHNDAGNLMLDRKGNVWIGTWVVEQIDITPRQASLITISTTQKVTTLFQQTVFNLSTTMKMAQFG